MGKHRPHPHFLETGAIWGSAPARLTVWSCPLFYWPKSFHWVPLTFGASVECLVLGATCLYFHVCAVFSFPNAGMAPFRPRRMCPRLPMGPHMIPRMHKRFNRLPALPSLCSRGWMSWYCLTERHCPAVCPGLGRRHSWRGGTHHAVWSGVSYRVLVLLF